MNRNTISTRNCLFISFLVVVTIWFFTVFVGPSYVLYFNNGEKTASPCDSRCCEKLKGDVFVPLDRSIPIVPTEVQPRVSEPPPTPSQPSQPPLPTTPTTPTPPPPKNLINGKPFTLEIKLLTYDRLGPLQRCIRSLASANYDGDQVDLQVFVDHYRIKPNMSLADHQAKHKIQQDILDFLTGFKWDHGRFDVHFRHVNANLQIAWLEAFYPLNNHTYAFVVEDDMAVSPFYYLYLKKLLAQYRYGEKVDKRMYGISFQRQRLVPGLQSGKQGNTVVANGDQPYMYSLVGTWGQIVFPEHWRDFRKYFDQRRFTGNASLLPFLEGTITNVWYKAKKEEIWTPWIIRWAFANNFFNLYTNFPARKALSTSFRNSGSNFNKNVGQDAPLITERDKNNFWKVQYNKQLVLVQNLKKFDYCFREIVPGSLFNITDNEITPTILPKPAARTILAVVQSTDPKRYIKNQLCGIEQYVTRAIEATLKKEFIFLTDDTNLSDELVVRGFQAVLDKQLRLSEIITTFLNTTQPPKLLVLSPNFQRLKRNPISSTEMQEPFQLTDQWALLNSRTLPIIQNELFQTTEQLIDLLRQREPTLTSNNSTAALTGVELSQFEPLPTDEVWNTKRLISNDDLACKRINCRR